MVTQELCARGARLAGGERSERGAPARGGRHVIAGTAAARLGRFHVPPAEGEVCASQGNYAL